MPAPKTAPAWRRAFLRELARSGNAAGAARACGLDPTFPYQLRRRNAAFATSWERALAKAGESLGAPGSEAGAEGPCGDGRSPEAAPAGNGASAGGDRSGGARTRPVLRPDEIVRNSRNGRPKIVRVKQGRWTSRVEAAFLAELTATANVNAAALAAGVTPQCVYMRRRRYPAFRAEWEAAVEEGFARIETLVVCAATATLNPEPLPERAFEEPPMTVDQALKVWLTHRAGGPGARKRRPGGLPRREPDIEEVRAEILRKVAAMEKAEAMRGGGAERRAENSARAGTDPGRHD